MLSLTFVLVLFWATTAFILLFFLSYNFILYTLKEMLAFLLSTYHSSGVDWEAIAANIYIYREIKYIGKNYLGLMMYALPSTCFGASDMSVSSTKIKTV